MTIIRAVRIAHLDPDAPHDIPMGLRPRRGIDYGCGKWTCTDCYEPDVSDGTSEDRCGICNRLIGIGIPALHIGICDDCRTEDTPQ
jgi:hypothetical protein